MLKITDILPELLNIKTATKIHCATGSTDKLKPLYLFSKGLYKDWQEEQNNKNFEREYILSLIYMKEYHWLFAGIYKSLSVKEHKNGAFKYKTELLPIKTDIIGKLIVYFEKDFRNSYLLLENNIDSLFIHEIRSDKYYTDPFPGYENVNISFDTLNTIIEIQEPTWYSSLSNVKGVYIITDKTNGKHYIGSAYGDYSFWQRWKEYATSGHGGNTILKRLISDNGIEYASNFQFSIIEIRSMTEDNDTIIARETFWKNVYLTKIYGYNDN